MPADRQPEVCPADLPLCPSCHTPLRRMTVVTGSTVVVCDESSCGQHCFVTAASDGICLVLTVSREEAEAIREAPEKQMTPTARQVYKELKSFSDMVDEGRLR